jgi:prevent-host-death family protein
LIEGQQFRLWAAPSPLRRQLLSNPIVSIQQMAAKKRVDLRDEQMCYK